MYTVYIVYTGVSTSRLKRCGAAVCRSGEVGERSEVPLTERSGSVCSDILLWTELWSGVSSPWNDATCCAVIGRQGGIRL